MTDQERTAPYEGPFPRKRHSHRCTGCAAKYGQYNAVACYKTYCRKPQLMGECSWCRPHHTESAHD